MAHYIATYTAPRGETYVRLYTRKDKLIRDLKPIYERLGSPIFVSRVLDDKTISKVLKEAFADDKRVFTPRRTIFKWPRWDTLVQIARGKYPEGHHVPDCWYELIEKYHIE